jgi:hypothetical protein
MALIVRDKDTLKEHVAIGKQLEYATAKPYIERAENEYIIPEIGQLAYNDIIAFIDSVGTPEADATVLSKSEAAISNICLNLAFDVLAVHVSDTGIQRVESQTHKAAYQYQEVNLKNNLLDSGLEVLGKLLEYLEENKTTFTIWAGDTATYNRFKNLTVHTPALFSDVVDIKNSWSIFFRLRSIIKKIEDLCLQPVLGTAFLAEIKAEIVADTTTNADLIAIIRKAVVYLVLADAANSKVVQFGKDGTFEVRRAGTAIRKEDPAQVDRLSAFINKNEADGDKYLKMLVDHLNNNASASKYATYYASNLYNDPSATDYSNQTWDNKSTGKSYIV